MNSLLRQSAPDFAISGSTPYKNILRHRRTAKKPQTCFASDPNWRADCSKNMAMKRGASSNPKAPDHAINFRITEKLEFPSHLFLDAEDRSQEGCDAEVRKANEKLGWSPYHI